MGVQGREGGWGSKGGREGGGPREGGRVGVQEGGVPPPPSGMKIKATPWGGGGGGGRASAGAHVWRAAMTPPRGHITEAQPREILVLGPPEQDGSCRAYLRTPLRPGCTGPHADMRGVTVRSTSRVLVVRSDGPGPPESAYPRKPEGDAGRPWGFTPD